MNPSRRTFFTQFGAGLTLAQRLGAAVDLKALRSSQSRVDPLGGGADVKALKLDRAWSGDICKSKLTNPGKQPVRVKQIVLFAAALDLPPESHLYGESLHFLRQPVLWV